MRLSRRTALALIGGAVAGVLCLGGEVAARTKHRQPTIGDIDVVARTVWGEARGEPWRGKVAVVWVLRNRAAQALAYMEKTGAKRHALYGDGSLSSAARMPYQFSVWNRRDPNRKKLATAHKSAAWPDCVRAVLSVMDGTEPDPVSTATHYTELKARPAWAKGRTPVTVIQNHKFFTLTHPPR